MKKELIIELLQKFEQAAYGFNDIECWSARELQTILGYTQWRNFVNIIDKAKDACKTASIAVSDHFADISKTIEMPNGAEKKIDDFALTRYACYLIAQNGDPTKSEIAFAQTYFAVQTRKQEIIEQRLLDVARVNAREKLTKSEKKLSSVSYERGVDDKGFAMIRSLGDKALFGGFTTNDMKRKLMVPDNRPLADFLPTLTIKAKDFATELTSHNVVEKDLKGHKKICTEHVENNSAVRKMLIERGVQPEKLPPSEDVKKVKRRLESEEKKVSRTTKKLNRI
ncbi:MAG: DNA damage-inducible protein D [Bacteroidota bacterium]